MRCHAIQLQETGGPEVLRWEEVEVGDPAAGDVLLRQTAVGLNYIDVYHRTGLYPVPLPGGIGLEGAAVVEKIGPGVDDLRVGDRVAYASAPLGAYAEWRISRPSGWSDPRRRDRPAGRGGDAAGDDGRISHPAHIPGAGRPGVLFHAAAGGVGLIACQWLKHLGARVIGTAGGPEKMALAQRNGCEHVIDSRGEPIAARVRELTGGAGVAVAYDSVGKDTFMASLDSVARRGMLVIFGNSSGPVPAVRAGGALGARLALPHAALTGGLHGEPR